MFIDIIERLMVSIAADVSCFTIGCLSLSSHGMFVNVFTSVVISCRDTAGHWLRSVDSHLLNHGVISAETLHVSK